MSAQALTIGEERDFGEKLLYSVRGSFQVLDYPDIHRYINDLGQEVLKVAGPQYFDYHFFVINSSNFNAFAAPAGLVFFYTGLVEQMKDEDELLSVMAHEVGHATSRHIAQRVDKSSKIGAVSVLTAIAGLALGIPSLSQGIFVGSLAAGQSAQLHYSRHDEEQADRLSFEWMQKMGRNPVALEKMLRTMLRIARYQTSQLPQYLLTHPNPEIRIGYVQSLLDSDEHQSEANYYTETDDFAFLRFKYRLMFLSNDPEQMKTYCLHQLNAAQNHEQSIMAQFGLALVECAERNHDAALRYLHNVQQAYPDKDILRVDEAMIYFDKRDFDSAEKILDQALHRDPEDVYAAFLQAQVAYEKKDYIGSEKLYIKLSERLPEYAQLFFEMGRLYADKGEQGISRFYLGKYNLYKGKVRPAMQLMERTVKDGQVPKDIKDQAQFILDKLKKIIDKDK